MDLSRAMLEQREIRSGFRSGGNVEQMPGPWIQAHRHSQAGFKSGRGGKERSGWQPQQQAHAAAAAAGSSSSKEEEDLFFSTH